MRLSPLKVGPLLYVIFQLFFLVSTPGSAQALLRLDFEQKYFIHQDRQVWDFSMVRPDSVYHIFYHTIHESTPHASSADTIWHSTSKDLKHWTIEGPILTVGPESWDAGAMWAPDVFYDDASQMWKIAYTGCDSQLNQRICMAESPNLYEWSKLPSNPTIEPDPEEYIWDDQEWWSNFRDPFIFRENNQWHILVTALQWLGESTGVLYHGVSDDLQTWTDVGIFFQNDSQDPWRVLESPQYKKVGDYHFLFFGEYDTGGLSVVSSRNLGNLSMASREVFDYGYAPELDEFDPDQYVISRLAPYLHPQTDVLSYAVRIDTMLFTGMGDVSVYRSPPLAENWETWGGISCLANPTFGDNPDFRGDDSVGMVGNSYFGSSEYYQGPLSGKGSPGTRLGDVAKGYLSSYPFIATGDRIELLVGGGYYPETCYVALVDASTEEVLYSETGNGQNLMTQRIWDIRPYQGRTLYVDILDDETGDMGFINIDEIIEIVDPLSPVNPVDVRHLLKDYGASPNPFNPSTRLHFALNSEMDVQIRIHDIRGRLVWQSSRIQGLIGDNFITWQGVNSQGQAAPAGTYLYTIESQGKIASSGKLSLVK
ncbi:MAG: family 43 glycosylhydrolase [bacterium]|nr:family 43 glycosylhydrolase [bacterium]